MRTNCSATVVDFQPHEKANNKKQSVCFTNYTCRDGIDAFSKPRAVKKTTVLRSGKIGVPKFLSSNAEEIRVTTFDRRRPMRRRLFCLRFLRGNVFKFLLLPREIKKKKRRIPWKTVFLVVMQYTTWSLFSFDVYFFRKLPRTPRRASSARCLTKRWRSMADNALG